MPAPMGERCVSRSSTLLRWQGFQRLKCASAVETSKIDRPHSYACWMSRASRIVPEARTGQSRS